MCPGAAIRTWTFWRARCETDESSSQSGQCDPNKFFSSIVKRNVESSLDDVSFGNVQAAVVDAVALEIEEDPVTRALDS